MDWFQEVFPKEQYPRKKPQWFLTIMSALFLMGVLGITTSSLVVQEIFAVQGNIPFYALITILSLGWGGLATLILQREAYHLKLVFGLQSTIGVIVGASLATYVFIQRELGRQLQAIGNPAAEIFTNAPSPALIFILIVVFFIIPFFLFTYKPFSRK